MTLPNCPGKHDAPSVFTAKELINQSNKDFPAVPSALILCFQDQFFEETVETYSESEQLLEPGGGQLYEVSNNVAVADKFGIGSAKTAAVVEEMSALGTETICILGGAGCLDPEIPPDDAILPTRAIRDEGPSYHYLPPDASANPTPGLVETLSKAITESGISVHEGPTWTIDAFYRETVPEGQKYSSEGFSRRKWRPLRSSPLRTTTIWTLMLYSVWAIIQLRTNGRFPPPATRSFPTSSNQRWTPQKHMLNENPLNIVKGFT